MKKAVIISDVKALIKGAKNPQIQRTVGILARIF